MPNQLRKTSIKTIRTLLFGMFMRSPLYKLHFKVAAYFNLMIR